VQVKLHDLELWDQDGAKVRFRSDLIGDRVAVIVPFYTRCTTAYPILIFTFSKLQERLGDRLGKDVVLVSISVDPKTDIPVRLKAFARKQKARPGWTFVSGTLDNLAKVVTGIGVQYIVGQSLDEHNHIPLTLVGSADGEWKRLHGYPSPDMLKRQVEEALAARGRKEGSP
jgi:protein SCO1/2